MTRRPAVALVLAAIVFANARAAAAAGDPAASAVSAGGYLAWIFSPDLDLIGDLRADVPFALSGPRGLYVSVDALTAIEKASSDFTFKVKEVGYDLEAGARRTLASGRVLSAFAGRRGRERVDSPGEPYVAYAGCGIQSAGFRSASWSRALEWRADLSAVADERDVDATLVLRGDLRWLHRAGAAALGADVAVEALAGGGEELSADVALGPRIDVELPGGRRVAFFARYLRSRNPLGLGASGVTLGFDYAEGPAAGPGPRPSPPEVSGDVGAGSGGGRSAGRLRVLVASPAFRGRYRAVLDVDANVLTGRDADELYYLYHVGIERAGERRVAGVYGYHRSNHELARTNDTVTSVNVLEAGIESAGYDRVPARDSRSRLGTLDYRARFGAVVQSTGGGSGRANVRGGVRWSLCRPDFRAAPFARFEAEEGHIDRWAASAGAAFSSGWAAWIERRYDDQYFGREKRAWLVSAGRSF